MPLATGAAQLRACPVKCDSLAIILLSDIAIALYRVVLMHWKANCIFYAPTK